MKLRHLIMVGLLPCLLTPLALFADEGEDSRTHSIRIQVLLVESSNDLGQDELQKLSGPSGSVMKTLMQLAADDKAAIVNHAELTVLEEQKAMLQIGETVSVRTGTIRSRAELESRTYQNVSVGTLISLMTKVVDDHVVIDFDFSKSFVKPREDDDSERREGTTQLTHQSTLRIKNGDAQLVARMMSHESGQEPAAAHLIVAAEILDSSASSQTTRFRSFPQRSSRSSSANTQTDARSRTRGMSSGPSEEARRRLGNAMFQRADSNRDGKISGDELSRLNPRDSKMKTPIQKDDYVDWIATEWQPTRSSNTPGFRRPAPPRTRPERNEEETEIEVERVETDEQDDAQSKRPEADQDPIGKTQIEFVPEDGTLVIRGTKADVERVKKGVEP